MGSNSVESILSNASHRRRGDIEKSAQFGTEALWANVFDWLDGAGAVEWVTGPSAEEYRDFANKKTEFMEDAPYAALGAGVGSLAGAALGSRPLYTLGGGAVGAYLGNRYGRDIAGSVRDWLSQRKKQASYTPMAKRADWGDTWEDIKGGIGSTASTLAKLNPAFMPPRFMYNAYHQGPYEGAKSTLWGTLGAGMDVLTSPNKVYGGLRRLIAGDTAMEATGKSLQESAERYAPRQARMQMAAYPAAIGGMGGMGYNWLTGSNSYMAPLVGALGLGAAGYFAPEVAESLGLMDNSQEKSASASSDRVSRNVKEFLKQAMTKRGYIERQEGTNSKGEKTKYVIKSHENDEVLGHYKTKEDAEAALRAMKAHSDD